MQRAARPNTETEDGKMDRTLGGVPLTKISPYKGDGALVAVSLLSLARSNTDEAALRHEPQRVRCPDTEGATMLRRNFDVGVGSRTRLPAAASTRQTYLQDPMLSLRGGRLGAL